MAGLSDQSGFLHEISLTLAGFAILSAILLPTQRHERGPKNTATPAAKYRFRPKDISGPLWYAHAWQSLHLLKSRRLGR